MQQYMAQHTYFREAKAEIVQNMMEDISTLSFHPVVHPTWK